MITSVPLTAVLPVSDLDRAASFYRDRLGLPDAGVEPTGNHLLRAGGGATIALMAAEEGAQSKHTVLTFEVKSIDSEVKDLEARGVSFLDYDEPEIRTVDHIAEMNGEKAAWFTDTEGNILCLHETSMAG